MLKCLINMSQTRLLLGFRLAASLGTGPIWQTAYTRTTLLFYFRMNNVQVL